MFYAVCFTLKIRMLKFHPPGLQNVALLGNKRAANAIPYNEDGLEYGGPLSNMTGILLYRVNLSTDPHTERTRRQRSADASTSWRAPIANNQREPRRRPFLPSREGLPAVTWPRTSSLHSCQTMNVCGLSHPSSWYFATEALRNHHTL